MLAERGREGFLCFLFLANNTIHQCEEGGAPEYKAAARNEPFCHFLIFQARVHLDLENVIKWLIYIIILSIKRGW